jgi:hypothetical protein
METAVARRPLPAVRTSRRALVLLAAAVGGGTAVATAALLGAAVVGIDGAQHRVHDVAAAGFLGGVLAAGLLAYALAPERRIAALQQAIVGFVVLLAAMLASAELDFRLGFVVFPVLLVLLHPERGELVRRRGFNPALAALALLGGVPLLAFAEDQLAMQRLDVPGLMHWEQNHWTGVAALAVAIPLVGLLAAFKTPGWRIPAWSAGGASVVFGLASLVLPDQASSVAPGWAAAAVAGGLVFVALAERDDPSRPAT